MTVAASPNGRTREAAAAGEAAAASDGAASPDAGTLLEAVIAELRGFAASLTGIVALEWQRLRLRALDLLLYLALFLVLMVAALAAAAAAGISIVAGTSAALTKWSGAEWIGELGAGLLMVAVFAVVWSLVRRVVRRRLVAAAVRRPVEDESEPEAS